MQQNEKMDTGRIKEEALAKEKYAEYLSVRQH